MFFYSQTIKFRTLIGWVFLSPKNHSQEVLKESSYFREWVQAVSNVLVGTRNSLTRFLITLSLGLSGGFCLNLCIMQASSLLAKRGEVFEARSPGNQTTRE